MTAGPWRRPLGSVSRLRWSGGLRENHGESVSLISFFHAYTHTPRFCEVLTVTDSTPATSSGGHPRTKVSFGDRLRFHSPKFRFNWPRLPQDS
jgi:hypothetical protein